MYPGLRRYHNRRACKLLAIGLRLLEHGNGPAIIAVGCVSRFVNWPASGPGFNRQSRGAGIEAVGPGAAPYFILDMQCEGKGWVVVVGRN